jgi:hypothetical protein
LAPRAAIGSKARINAQVPTQFLANDHVKLGAIGRAFILKGIKGDLHCTIQSAISV